jgi:hypothetical protein
MEDQIVVTDPRFVKMTIARASEKAILPLSMPLVDIWKSSPEQIRNKTVQQHFDFRRRRKATGRQ